MSIQRAETTPFFPSSPRSTAPHVRVKEWYFGTEHKNSDIGYDMSWKKTTMTLKQGLGQSPPLLQLDVRSGIESIMVRPYLCHTARYRVVRYDSIANTPLDRVSNIQSSLCKRLLLTIAAVSKTTHAPRYVCCGFIVWDSSDHGNI